MTFSEITQILEQWAPPALQESYDNAGLIAGEFSTECTGILINLDLTEEVIDEAINQNCNLVVTHHPIWFRERKRLNGEDFVSRCIIKAIRNNVGLYAIHTNLDNVHTGVNAKIADNLGLQNTRILAPKKSTLHKLTTYIPAENHMEVLEAIWEAGAGKIGEYDKASFSHKGTGTFRPSEDANPHSGSSGKLSQDEEIRTEVVFPYYLGSAVLGALKKAHPYEEVAYQIVSTENSIDQIGSGMIGELQSALKKDDFLELLKTTFKCGGIRYADSPAETIQKVAICGGAGGFLIGNALKAGADAFVSGDITYHKYFENENRMMVCDIGHYESEQFTSELLHQFLSEKIANFAVRLSKVNTNPVKYY